MNNSENVLFQNSVGVICDNEVLINDESLFINDLIHMDYFFLVNGKLDFYFIIIMIFLFPIALFFKSFLLFVIALIFGFSTKIPFYKEFYITYNLKSNNYLATSKKVTCKKEKDIKLFVSNFELVKKKCQKFEA